MGCIHLIIILLFCISVQGQSFEDKRCRCTCPNIDAITQTTNKSNRRLYIAYVPPNECNCLATVIPQIPDDINIQSMLLCSHCECKYETRNTTVIMVVVIIVLWSITLLSGYQFFLIVLKPLINKDVKYHQECGSDEAIHLLLLEDHET